MDNDEDNLIKQVTVKNNENISGFDCDIQDDRVVVTKYRDYTLGEYPYTTTYMKKESDIKKELEKVQSKLEKDFTKKWTTTLIEVVDGLDASYKYALLDINKDGVDEILGIDSETEDDGVIIYYNGSDATDSYYRGIYNFSYNKDMEIVYFDHGIRGDHMGSAMKIENDTMEDILNAYTQQYYIDDCIYEIDGVEVSKEEYYAECEKYSKDSVEVHLEKTRQEIIKALREKYNNYEQNN